MQEARDNTSELKEEILRLQQQAQPLEPQAEERTNLWQATQEYAAAFLEVLPGRKAFEAEDVTGRLLQHQLPGEEGKDILDILALLGEAVDTPGLNPASGGHLGYIPGGGIYTSALGDYLAAVTNRYAGVFYASPGAVRIENLLIRWMAGLAGFPATAGGTLTSGGSVANLTAIVTARDAKQVRSGDVPRSVIYLTSQAHHSIEKAIRIAGLSESVVREIPVDDGFRMRADLLLEAVRRDTREGLKPFLVIATMGTTDTGAIDPLDEIAGITTQYSLWLHVDAAYGGFFLLCDGIRRRFGSLGLADSIVMDPHKGLFVPYGLGALLVRDVAHLAASQHYSANYMQDTHAANEELSPAELSPELSRHFRGLRLWLPLQLHGIAPFRAALTEKLYLAQYAYEELRKMENMEVFNKPELTVVAFRYVPPAGDADRFNRELILRIQQDGRVFLSSTLVDGKFALRIAVLSFRSHLETVDLALQIIQEKVLGLQNAE